MFSYLNIKYVISHTELKKKTEASCWDLCLVTVQPAAFDLIGPLKNILTMTIAVRRMASLKM